MSHNYPYRRSPEDFSSHQGAFSTSDHLHHEERHIYQTSLQPSPRSTSVFTSQKSVLDSYSSRSSTTADSALSLLSSCGLEPEDLSILAGMPENMMTEESLPRLLMEIRQKKALSDRSCLSSTHRSTSHQPLQPPSDSWENSARSAPAKYLANPPQHSSYPPIPPLLSSYPLPREEPESWKDRWGNPRQTGAVRQGKTSSTYVVDYNYGQPQEGDSRNIERPAYSARGVGIGERPHLQSLSDYRQLNPGKEPAAAYQKKLIPLLATTVHSTPTAREANDFHGSMPQTFPYACYLCDIAVLSQKDWTLHINGAQHANSQLAVLQMYPEWDCRTGSARQSDYNSEKGREDKNTGGRRHVAPQHHGVTSSCEGKSYPIGDKASGRVVCAKYAANSMDEHSIRRLVGQVGSAVNVMMFPVQAFIEMSSPDEAQDVVKYFNRNPVVVEGSLVQFSMSATYNFLQSSPVVIFSLLPPGHEKYSEIMAIAKRFGPVKHSLFLPNQVLLEMGSREDAGKLVQYYTSHPLKMKGSIIQVSHSTKHSTLKFAVTDKETESGEASRHVGQSYRSQTRSSPSPRRRSPSPRRSPGPRRRSPSPRRSPGPRRRSPSPRRRPSCTRWSPSPKTFYSPRRRSPTPRRRSCSPRRRSPGPRRRSCSPRRRSPGPRRRSCSPRRRSPSPRRRSCSPSRRSPSPRRRSPNQRKRSSGDRRRSHSPRRKSLENRDVAKLEDKASQVRTPSSSRNRSQSSRWSTSHTKEDKNISRVHSVEKTANTQNAIVKSIGVLTETPDLGSTKEPSCTNTQTKESVPSPTEHPQDHGTGQKTEDQTMFEGGKDSDKDSDMDSDIEGMAVIGEDEEIRSEEGSMGFLEDMEEHVCDEAGTSAENLSTCPSEVAEAGEKEKQGEGEELALHPDKEPGSQSPTADPAVSEPPGVTAVHEEKEGGLEDMEEPNEAYDEDEPDFPESLEHCITLDELEDEDGEGQALVSEGNSDPRSKEEEQENDYGRVIYIQNLPSGYYTDKQFVAIGKKYGKVNRYFLIRRRQEGFIEMERSADARRAVRELSKKPLRMARNILVVHLSRKYKRLTCGWSPESDSEDESGWRKHRRERRRMEEREDSSSRTKSRKEEEPPSKKVCIREEKTTPAEPSSSIKAEEKTATVEPSSNGEQQQEEEEKAATEESSSNKEQQQEEEERSATEEPSSHKEQQQEEEEKAATEEPSSHKEQQQEEEEKAATEEPSSHKEQQQEEEEKAATEEPSSHKEQQQEEEEYGTPETPCEQEELAVKTENENIMINRPSDCMDTLKKDTEGVTSIENPDGIKQVYVKEEKVEMITETTHVPLGPYLPNNPMGREFVSQKIGYFCSLCNAIYVTEDEARNEHCSSHSHYEKLKAYMEQKGNPARQL
ncbi:matrin-3-like isoform X4 [Anguilla rostrata]|uniref:matrin-3-like isoform X4 n=1 Tax=Anguilla rostrata TaxID=7938 RepID=UPI0030D06A9D